MKGTPFSVRRLTEDDVSSAVELLVRIFGEGEVGSRRTAAWFHWKYFENPAGHESVLAEDRDGNLVGFYGGVPQIMRVDGEDDGRFGQACDTCTDPAVRRGLRNPGLFVRLAQAYLSSSAQPDRDSVGYGLPMPEAYRMGSRYLDYWMLRTQLILTCRQPDLIPDPSDEISVEVMDVFPDEIDGYFDNACETYALCARRDAAFLNWRFAAHPEKPYTLGLARDGSGALRGHAVYRKGTLAGREAGIVMDWFVDPDDEVGARTLGHWIAHNAAAEGMSELMFITPTVSVWTDRFQEWGFRPEPSPYVMVARCCDSNFQPKFVRDNWYYTLADFDLM